jgi:hypothetical protein
VNAMSVPIHPDRIIPTDEGKAESHLSNGEESSNSWSRSNELWNGRHKEPEIKSTSNNVSPTTFIGNMKRLPEVGGRSSAPGFVYANVKDKPRSEGMNVLAIISIVFSSLFAALLFTGTGLFRILALIRINLLIAFSYSGCSLLLVYKLSVFKKRRFLCFNRRRQDSPEQLETNDAIRSTANLTKTNPLHSLVASGKLVPQSTNLTTKSVGQTIMSCHRDVTFRSNQRHQDVTFAESSSTKEPIDQGLRNTVSNRDDRSESIQSQVAKNGSSWIRTLKTTAEPRSNALTRFLGKMTGNDESSAMQSIDESSNSIERTIASDQHQSVRSDNITSLSAANATQLSAHKVSSSVTINHKYDHCLLLINFNLYQRSAGNIALAT